MKVLVTGGAGFIGSGLVNELIKKSDKKKGHGVAIHDVAIVDNLSTGLKENLNKKARFYNIDITKLRDLKSVFSKEKPEIVFHLAAQVNLRKSIKDTVFDAVTNIKGTINVLECMAEFKCKKIVYSSTAAVYGSPDKLPIKEDMRLKPENPYGISKKACEEYIKFYSNEYGFDYTILRYSNVYGPGQNAEGEAGVITIFAKLLSKNKSPKIFGDGTQTRDYVYVKDVISANLMAMKSTKTKIFNIGSGVETSVNELFKKLAALTNFKGVPEKADSIKGEVKRSCFDCSLAEKELGWKAKTTLYEGLKLTVRSMQ